MSEGLVLTVVGSGNASNAAGRGHSCYWLEGVLPAGALMVDFGATALAGLKGLGLDPERLAVLALTHLHGDHMGGFAYLLIDALYDRRRQAPLKVIGPRGVRARLLELLRVTYGSLADKDRPFDLEFVELAPGEVHELGPDARLVAFAADHQEPPEAPLCLRVEAGEQAVAFSGDTRFCPGLFAAARGAALLVAECSALSPPCGAHCSWEEWRARAHELECPRLLLTHLGEDVRARIPELLGQGLGPGLELEFADDGQTLTLPL